MKLSGGSGVPLFVTVFSHEDNAMKNEKMLTNTKMLLIAFIRLFFRHLGKLVCYTFI